LLLLLLLLLVLSAPFTAAAASSTCLAAVCTRLARRRSVRTCARSRASAGVRPRVVL
jgi:hypothetical protein